MRKLLFIFLFLSVVPAQAQTKFFLRTTTSALGVFEASSYTGYGCNSITGNRRRYLASTTAGSAGTSYTQTLSSTAPPCDTSDGTAFYRWFSPPLSTGLTISGNIDFNISCSESNAALNAGMRMIVYRWSVQVGGVVSTIITSADTTECSSGPVQRRAIAAAALTSTVMEAGDRLVFQVEVRNVGGSWGGNGSYTSTLQFNAAAGSTGDTFANFANTISFAADTNNGRAVVSRLFGSDAPLRRALQRQISARETWTRQGPSQPPRTCPWKFLTGCFRSSSLASASL